MEVSSTTRSRSFNIWAKTLLDLTDCGAQMAEYGGSDVLRICKGLFRLVLFIAQPR